VALSSAFHPVRGAIPLPTARNATSQPCAPGIPPRCWRHFLPLPVYPTELHCHSHPCSRPLMHQKAKIKQLCFFLGHTYHTLGSNKKELEFVADQQEIVMGRCSRVWRYLCCRRTNLPGIMWVLGWRSSTPNSHVTPSPMTVKHKLTPSSQGKKSPIPL
jgi:hypothetical protein